jgi:hypothetical protein
LSLPKPQTSQAASSKQGDGMIFKKAPIESFAADFFNGIDPMRT